MLDLADHDSTMLDNDEDEELVESLPDAEKKLDVLLHAKIKRVVNDEEHFGTIDEIEVGSVSKERLYRVQYEDGDLEHLTEAQVKACKVPEAPAQALAQGRSSAGKSRSSAAAAKPVEDNDGDDEEDEEENDEEAEEEEEEEEEEEKPPPAKEARKSSSGAVTKKPAAARPSTLPSNKAKAKAAPAQAKGKVVTKVTKKPAKA